MVRHYANKRISQSRRGSLPQALLIIVAFLMGYLTASVFDPARLSHWLNTQVLASDPLQHESKSLPRPVVVAIPPKPKFEFYTLLANEKASGSASPREDRSLKPEHETKLPPPDFAVKVIEKPAVSEPIKGNSAYLVQVASFKSRREADQMKGNLILKGFDVQVVPITYVNKGSWFRVVVGPYANRELAQEAQLGLAKKEHLQGILITKANNP